MKFKTKTILGLAALTAITLIVYVKQKEATRIKLAQLAEEEYETAHDIMYPSRYIRSKDLRYGPVLPN